VIQILTNSASYKVYFFITLGVIEFLATTTIHIEVMESIWDKANHFTAFFVLYILLNFAYRNLKILPKIVLLIAFGLQIEIVQSFIDGRYFSLLDVLADSIGIAIGVGVIYLLKGTKFIKVFS